MINKTKLILITWLCIVGTCTKAVPIIPADPSLFGSVNNEVLKGTLKYPLVWLYGNSVEIKKYDIPTQTENTNIENKRIERLNNAYNTTYGLTSDYLKFLSEHCESSLLVVDSEKKMKSPLMIRIKITTDSWYFYKYAELKGVYFDASKINESEDLEDVLGRTIAAMTHLVQETTAGANKGLYNTFSGGWRALAINNLSNDNMTNLSNDETTDSGLTGLDHVKATAAALYQGVSDVAHAAYGTGASLFGSGDPGVVSSKAMLKDIRESLEKNMPTGINSEKAKIIRDTVNSFIAKQKA